MIHLDDIRREIDDIDTRIANLVAERILLQREAAIWKRERDLPAYDGNREREVFQRYADRLGDFGRDIAWTFLRNRPKLSDIT